jgi:pimeloyl-[acyl-carrier protein] methyl ester esterase
MELVLIPGMDGTGRLFAPFLTAMGNTMPTRVLPYADRGAAGYERLADELAPHLPSSPFILLGESFAGPLAILLAAKRPPGLSGLILAATFARSPRPWARRLSPVLPLVSMTRAWAHASLPFLIGNRAPVELKRTYIEAVSGIDSAALRTRLSATLDVDVSTELAGIGVPILCIRASRDIVVPRDASRHIAAIRPDAIVAVVDGPHCILQANPRHAADHIRAFVGRISA